MYNFHLYKYIGLPIQTRRCHWRNCKHERLLLFKQILMFIGWNSGIPHQPCMVLYIFYLQMWRRNQLKPNLFAHHYGHMHWTYSFPLGWVVLMNLIPMLLHYVIFVKKQTHILREFKNMQPKLVTIRHDQMFWAFWIMLRISM